LGVVHEATKGSEKVRMPPRDDDGKYPAYAWPGGYPILYVADDGEWACPACVNGENGAEFSADPDHDADGWRIEGYQVHWEGEPAICSHCGASIESAYGDPDSERK